MNQIYRKTPYISQTLQGKKSELTKVSNEKQQNLSWSQKKKTNFCTKNQGLSTQHRQQSFQGKYIISRSSWYSWFGGKSLVDDLEIMCLHSK